MGTIVTPYEVKGNIDYSKLIKKFGVSAIDNKQLKLLEKHTGEIHHLLRRQIFFAHRDFEKFLDVYEKKGKENTFLYTGCGPSGPIHMGHAIVWQFTKWLQDTLDVDLYFQFTDDEKFLYKNLSYDEIQKWLYENMLDVIALGFNPKKTHFIINTKHANLMYPQALKVAKKLTLSTVKSAFGFGNEVNVGSYFYTAMQAVPTFLPSVLHNKKMHCLIPHAIDQDAHFRLTRDIVPKLGYPKPSSIQSRFLPGLAGMEGSGKLSSSTGQAIYLTDTPKQVAKKINKYAFSGGRETVEEHRKKGGDINIDIAYQWLLFLEEDDNKLEKYAKDYSSGKLLSGEMKKLLINKINLFLADHQKRRENAEKQLSKFILTC